MASIDMCEHDWPGSGCKKCLMEGERETASKKRMKELPSWDLSHARAYQPDLTGLVNQVREEQTALHDAMLDWKPSINFQHERNARRKEAILDNAYHLYTLLSTIKNSEQLTVDRPDLHKQIVILLGVIEDYASQE